MKNILHIILIAFFSLTIISCSSDDSKTTDNTCTSSDVSFLAVGASGTLLTSADGTCWTAQTSGTTNNLRAFAIKPSTIGVVVGYSGTILTTTDGTTWTSRTSGTSNDINNVHYNSAGFVAVGDSGTLLTSSDGITWTDRTSSCGMTENIWDVSSSSSIAVAIGDNGSIYTSTDDGVNCTKRTSGTTVEFNELIYGDSTFVAVGDNGTVLTSDNGTTWTSRTSGTTNTLYGGAYYNAGGYRGFTLVGSSGKTIYSSDNGTTWTAWAAPSMTTDIFGFVRGGTTWVYVGRSGTIYTAGDVDEDVTARTSGTTESLRRVFYLGE
jgi:photosystem II stability/assembly factor-like uncharacterized protein